MAQTAKGAFAYEHSMNHCLEFYTKAGSSVDDLWSPMLDDILELFKASWYADKETSMKLLFWLRDVRGGAGNRGTSRKCIKWLADAAPEWLLVNLDLIPKYGRWDDLKVLFGTELEEPVANLWASAISACDVLAAKWADRNDLPLRKALNMKVGPFRRLLASIRKDHIVEHKMCSNEWDKIKYEHVPSVCMSRFSKLFREHDKEGFQEYLDNVKSGKKKINASVLFPHDCVRTARIEPEVADAQFDALPNYLEKTNDRIIVIADTSGSMGQLAFGQIRCVDVSQGMALYCSAKMPENSPFYKRFIDFGSESHFKDWRGHTFSEAVNNRLLFTEAVTETKVDRALMLILNTALEHNIQQELMPTVLMIVSDMQFDEGTDRSSDETVVEMCLRRWDEAGYERPRILYWNTSSFANTQITENVENVGMVSGFSPSILESVFDGEDFSPMSIMNRTIRKYEVKNPKKM